MIILLILGSGGRRQVYSDINWAMKRLDYGWDGADIDRPYFWCNEQRACDVVAYN